MKYLIDTDVFINHVRKRVTISAEILEAGAAISIITLGELLYGAHKSNNPARATKLINFTLKELNLDVLPLDEQAIGSFANLKAGLEKQGKRIEDFDLLIAATAKAYDLTLSTRNIRHFQRIAGLKLA